MKDIKNYYMLVRQMGYRWFFYRGFYQLQKRTGLLEKKMAQKEISLEEMEGWLGVGPDKELLKGRLGSFFFSPHDLQPVREWLRDNLAEGDKKKIVTVAEEAARGRILCFSKWYADYGDPMDWHLNPVTGNSFPPGVHWTKISELTPGEDIKYTWEASRFPQVYYLARAYLLTGDNHHARVFWEQVESWWESNPPGLGPNWFCGQEVALRSMAWIFGLHVFWQAPATTPVRIINLLRYLWVQGKRIEKNISFAVKAVANNHALSEAAGLFTLGLLFPFFPESGSWVRAGMKYLTREGLRQFNPEGSYLQNSFNYQRMVVQLYSWCFRLAQVNGLGFGVPLQERLQQCIMFLYSLQEPARGYLPNYGSNDGALPFILSTCDYRDYRPQMNALWYILKGKRLYVPGLPDEELAWFHGGELQEAGVESPSRQKAYPGGGYYIQESNQSRGVTRCTSHRTRPGHADMLHLDLWVKGENLLTDAGSYSYNCPGWSEYFKGTAGHNTVTLDNRDQMKKWGPFTWLNWTRSRLNVLEEKADYSYLEGEHYGYYNVIHRRAVICCNDLWVVIDDLCPSVGMQDKVNLKLHWLLGPYPWQLDDSRELLLATPVGPIFLYTWPGDKGTSFSVSEGQFEPKRGWCSLYYGEKEPVPSITLEADTLLPYRFITVVGLKEKISTYRVGMQQVNAVIPEDILLTLKFREPGEKKMLLDLTSKVTTK